jgi:hypothetical protein
VSFLTQISKSKLEFIIKPGFFSAFESRILSSPEEFPSMELVTLIPSFASRGYTPTLLLKAIKDDESFVMPSIKSVKDLLKAIMELGYDQEPVIYAKIFKQLKLASANMDINEV